MLVLSRFAGAAHELTEALIVNPFDPDAIADAMHLALTMPAAGTPGAARCAEGEGVPDHGPGLLPALHRRAGRHGASSRRRSLAAYHIVFAARPDHSRS